MMDCVTLLATSASHFNIYCLKFLADRTNGRTIATVWRPSSSSSSSVTLCIVAQRCILEQKLLSIGTKKTDLYLWLEVVSRSRQPLRYIWRSISRRGGTIWKLCEPKQRESGNGTALCPSTGWGFGVSPPRNFCNLWANLHSEPFPGQNDLQKFMQLWTCVWAKFSPYTCMLWYSLIIYPQ